MLTIRLFFIVFIAVRSFAFRLETFTVNFSFVDFFTTVVLAVRFFLCSFYLLHILFRGFLQQDFFILRLFAVGYFIFRLFVTRLSAVIPCVGENVVAGLFTLRLSAVEIFGIRMILSNSLLSELLSSEFLSKPFVR